MLSVGPCLLLPTMPTTPRSIARARLAQASSRAHLGFPGIYFTLTPQSSSSLSPPASPSPASVTSACLSKKLLCQPVASFT